MPRLTDAQILDIRREYTLHHNTAKTARKLGVNRRTVSLWIRRRNSKGRIHRHKPSGRKKKLSDKECKLAESLLLSAKFGTLRDTADELKRQLGISVSEKTLSKSLRQYSKSKGQQVKHVVGLPKKQLTRLNRQKRLGFCKKNLRRNWSNVMFTDRCKFAFQYPGVSARSCGWVKKGSSWEAPKVEHPSVYNVYGGITKYGATTLKEVTGSTKHHSDYKTRSQHTARNITSDEYYDVVASHFLPQGTMIFSSGPGLSSWVLQQDNDPTHKQPSKTALGDWAKKHPGQTVTLLKDWPPNSPDLSPIENVWAMVQQDAHKAACSTFDEFKAKVNELFYNSSKDTVKRLINSMKSRMQECIRKKGGKTKH